MKGGGATQGSVGEVDGWEEGGERRFPGEGGEGIEERGTRRGGGG